MKRRIGTIVGGAIAGVLVFSIWGPMAAPVSEGGWGITGGWFAGLFIVGLAWFVNHYIGIYNSPDGSAFVDMGLAIGVSGTMGDVFSGASFVDALPTLFWVSVGASIAGILAVEVQRGMNSD